MVLSQRKGLVMSTTGSSLSTGLRRGAGDSVSLIREADKAKANVDNVAIFAKIIKKAEENAQASL
ncbi:hypothetical protein [Pigmentiphaga sp.]|uniref:hypothetical protein n=1 Tax=Pigmentiphaga sp. TaxID=1977564 RepID=UPI0025D4328C|nr:hypothetical protein [Pigmentiphaga sp.]